MTSPTFATSPFCLRTWLSVPDSGAANSTVAFSLSKVTNGSSFRTGWPADFSNAPISTSVIDSPTSGTFSSIGINRDLFFAKCTADELGLLLFVPPMRTGRRRGRQRASYAGERPTSEERLTELNVHIDPGTHIARLFLHPEHRRTFGVGCKRHFE